VSKNIKSFGDVMPKIEFYPDLPKVELKDILDKEVEVNDAQVVADFTTKFGTHDFVLLLYTDPKDGTQYTTISSGMVIVKKLKYALDNRLLPLIGTITWNGQYYDIN
ncbi:unnamed protein product, partial [marine sediment metagenome]